MELNPISKTEAARYMGVKGEPDPQIHKLLVNAEKIVRENIRPKYVYREARFSFADDGVHVEGMNMPFTGGDIKKHLSGCTRIVILAVTLASEADKLIRQAEIEGMAEALAVDCICSAAVEQACETAETEIFEHISAPYRTWRFSPGYGDFPLALQKELLLFLNASRRIGLTATENSLLIPSKSVTAVIGVSDDLIAKQLKGCAVCEMRDRCAFSEKGGCGKK